MSKPLTDAEALGHYRDELNRTRTAIRDLADSVHKVAAIWGSFKAQDMEDALLRILGERP